jgi:uncharacterized protein (TIGR02594 family)
LQTKILLAVPVITFAQACSPTPREGVMPIHSYNVVNEAVQYIGMNENTDRQELKELSGVDPVQTEWCAAFLNAVLEESGVPSVATLGYDYPLTARSYLKWGVEVELPLPGDVVVFPRGNQGWQGHVGIFIEKREINGIVYYMILGGNQNNTVSIAPYKASSALGVRRFSI